VLYDGGMSTAADDAKRDPTPNHPNASPRTANRTSTDKDSQRAAAKLRILVGNTTGDKETITRAARLRRRLPKWIVPKSSSIGDEVVLFVGSDGFLATAQINTSTVPSKGWPGRYEAGLSSIELIAPAISAHLIRRHVPRLKWATYPRHYHTPTDLIAGQIQTLIDTRRKSGLPDIDDRALKGANLDELRRVAMLSSRKSVPGKSAKTVYRARSEAIRLYALERARGWCEGCGSEAPFARDSGSPYLEVHHITRVADKGPDHPAKVIALCPNCHTRAHRSRDRAQFAQKLRKELKRIEPSHHQKAPH
jgi:hypothetical protein